MELDRIVCADALEFLATLPDASCDMILCDLPYGDEKTKLAWDIRLPINRLWEEWARLIKSRSVIVLTATQPYTSHLVLSNPSMFRYCWYWEKQKSASFGVVKTQPLRVIEDILIFSHASAFLNQFMTEDQAAYYYPQMTPRERPQTRQFKATHKSVAAPSKSSTIQHGKEFTSVYTHSYPRNLLYFPDDPDRGLHPTQKPVALFEYLIRTYTQAGEVVLDCCMGSGTTAIAARQCGRHFVGCDKDAGYVEVARCRLAQPWQPMLLEFA